MCLSGKQAGGSTDDHTPNHHGTHSMPPRFLDEVKISMYAGKPVSQESMSHSVRQLKTDI